MNITLVRGFLFIKGSSCKGSLIKGSCKGSFRKGSCKGSFRKGSRRVLLERVPEAFFKEGF